MIHFQISTRLVQVLRAQLTLTTNPSLDISLSLQLYRGRNQGVC